MEGIDTIILENGNRPPPLLSPVVDGALDFIKHGMDSEGPSTASQASPNDARDRLLASRTMNQRSLLDPPDTFARLRAREVIRAGKDVLWFEILPFELRDQIFDRLDNVQHWSGWPYSGSGPYFSWQHSFPRGMPPLIQALRDSPGSYAHALLWFEKSKSNLDLYYRNNFDISTLTDSEALNVDRLELHVDSDAYLSHSPSDRAAVNETMATVLDRLPNLTFILVCLHDSTPHYRPFYALTDWASWFRTCRRLTTIRLHMERSHSALYDVKFRGGVHTYGKILGSTIKAVDGRSGISHTLYGPPFGWIAEEGGVLDWSWARAPLLDWERQLSRASLLTPWNFFDDRSGGGLKFLGGTFVIKKYCEPKQVHDLPAIRG